MTRVALDSNILVYAELEPETPKGRRAANLITRAAADGVIPIQALGAFLRVVQRRAPFAFAEAVQQVAICEAMFLTPPTTLSVMKTAAEAALAHQLQLWDSIICACASHAGATVQLTEDLQDGRPLHGLRVVNPFDSMNDAKVSAIFDE